MAGALNAASLPGGYILDMEGLNATYSDLGAATATYRIQLNFVADGLLDVIRGQGSDSLNDHEFANKTEGLSIRCVYVSGNHLDGGLEDTWQDFSVTRSYWLEHTTAGGSDEISGTFKFQLSKNGGTTVHSDSGDTVLTCGELF